MATPCYTRIIYGPTAGDASPDEDTNVILSPATKNRLTGRPQYAADGVTVAYIKYTLEVETVVYLETLTSTETDVEAEVKRIRDILNTPAQELVLHPVGLGQFNTINRTNDDVAGGPLTRSIFVQPIASNNAILVRWTVEFNLVECPSVTPSLVEYTVDQDFDVDDAGNFSYVTQIIYKSPTPITDINTYKSFTDILVRNASSSYQGMRKSKRSKLSRDGRTLTITLKYAEIQSDNAFFPHTHNIEVDDTVESSLFGSLLSGKGFYSWKRTIGGTVTLPARVHKAYAWVVIIKILRARFKNMATTSKIAAILDTIEASGQADDNGDKTNYFYLPLRIKITNRLYQRQLRFEVNYLLTSDLGNLFNSTKLFARVNTRFTAAEEESEPEDLSDQWLYWQQRKNIDLNGKFQYDTSGVPIVFNQCSGVVSNHQIGSSVELSHEEDVDWDDGETSAGGGSEETGQYEQALDAAYPERMFNDRSLPLSSHSWIKYNNEFEFIEDTNNIPVSYLEEPTSTYYTNGGSDGSFSDRDREDFSLNGKVTQATQTNPPVVVERGHSQFFVRMKGYAMRLGYQVPPPFIISVGGKTAIRHKVKVNHKQVSSGDAPIYLAKWDITYIIPGGDIYSNDILGDITGTGDPGHYA